MDAIRLATKEEIETIREGANFTPISTVLAYGEGENKVMGVLRTITEFDPMYFAPECPDRRKLTFLWGVETGLRMMGVPEYYFSVRTKDEQWMEVIKKTGAQALTDEPEIRFKKVL